jgi:uncharacterized protein (TIGR02996 family)
MTDRDALLAATLANPDEDTPRLVFADWLQENGRRRSRIAHAPDCLRERFGNEVCVFEGPTGDRP